MCDEFLSYFINIITAVLVSNQSHVPKVFFLNMSCATDDITQFIQYTRCIHSTMATSVLSGQFIKILLHKFYLTHFVGNVISLFYKVSYFSNTSELIH